LHVILGYVDILAEAEDGTMDRLTRDSYLQFIRESASALLLNMNEMMEIIRLQRSEQEVEFEVRRLGVVLQNVIAEVQPTLEAEDVTLEADNAVARRLNSARCWTCCWSGAGFRRCCEPARCWAVAEAC
jgi:signal transduction histidine kinase